MSNKSLWKGIHSLFRVFLLMTCEIQLALSQDEGEWTGRGWRGPSDGDSTFFVLFLVVAIAATIIHLINEGLPNFFPTLGGLLIIFVTAQFVTGILISLGADLHQDDSIVVFTLLLISLHIYDYYQRKKKNNKVGE